MPLPPYAPAAVSRIALVALAAGVGVWGAVLLAPAPARVPPAAVAGPAARTDTQPVARWFGGGGAKVQVTVAGLIAAGPHGSAVLAIDGRPPRAFAVGRQLADGVRLAEVRANGVVLDQDGERVEVPATVLPRVDGIRVLPRNP
ncbi:hypothetical protein GCM10023144_45890 [Pigmentiphaga soli]|uniref:General secretion pathway protein C n=1 Tax=Pigmentiphaga soli TaxID=1007095 RepID=A0ABP8HRJ9_9BURK